MVEKKADQLCWKEATNVSEGAKIDEKKLHEAGMKCSALFSTKAKQGHWSLVFI